MTPAFTTTPAERVVAPHPPFELQPLHPVTPTPPTPTAQLGEDPLEAAQWHLDALGDLQAVWADYDGAGVRVAVYDDGVLKRHPDLQHAFPGGGPIEIGGVLYSGDVHNRQAGHGTACAGIIAAARNGEGGVGIASGVTLSSVNIFDPLSSLYINANDPSGFFEALGEMSQFDVVNASWAARPIFFPGQDVSDPDSFAIDAIAGFDRAVREGRDGLGTLIVQSAGNYFGDANGQALNASRFTITVGASRTDGQPSSYTNFGPSLLISGPAGDDPLQTRDGQPGIVTTDRLGALGYNLRADESAPVNYTDNFGGTSAAAPMVAGVIALMLQANPNLGWRDVQDVLAYSARHQGGDMAGGPPLRFERNEWFFNGANDWNGGGLHYSEDHGFGGVDAFRAVRLAESWSLHSPAAKTSVNEQSFATAVLTIDQSIPGVGRTAFSFDFSGDVAAEHVALVLNLQHDFTLDLDIELTSPAGTTARVSMEEALVWSTFEPLTWTFGFEAFRGEDPNGRWTIAVVDHAGFSVGTLNTAQLRVYGSAPDADDVYVYNDELEAAVLASGPERLTLVDEGGVDWLDFASRSSGVTLDLTPGAASLLTIGSSTVIEHVVGGDGDDVINGNSADNRLHGARGGDPLSGQGGVDRLYGGAGADQLSGGLRRDILEGGAGADVLTGGRGPDRFVWRETTDSAPSAFDVVSGFDGARGDRLSLAQIDADVATRADDAFTWAAAFTGVAGQLVVQLVSAGLYRVAADVDGDAAADFELRVESAFALSAEHFVL